MYARESRQKKLEGQVVCGLSLTGRCGRERSGILRGEWSSLRSGGIGVNYGGCGYRSGTTGNIIGTDIIEPTSVELVGIDIERYGQVIAHLNVKLFDAVFAKHAEDTLARILTRNFDDIVL